MIPVFLVLALNSESGTDALPAVLFAVIGWSDYLDGIAARVTGQYSRMGALLDPLVDRMLVIAGVIVCWKFDLLPRWALALLAARELFMLVLARYAMHRGVELKINWLGPLGGLAGVQRAVLRALRSALAGPGVLVCRARAGARVDRAVRARWSTAGSSTRLDLSLMNAMLRHPSRRPEERTRFQMDTFPDLGSLSDQELKDLIQQLTDEEQEVSYRRRILHGKIDILRAELVNRLRKKHEGGEEVISGADVQRLTDILAGRATGAGGDDI